MRVVAGGRDVLYRWFIAILWENKEREKLDILFMDDEANTGGVFVERYITSPWRSLVGSAGSEQTGRKKKNLQSDDSRSVLVVFYFGIRRQTVVRSAGERGVDFGDQQAYLNVIMVFSHLEITSIPMQLTRGTILKLSLSELAVIKVDGWRILCDAYGALVYWLLQELDGDRVMVSRV
uniref:Uncharacterized protein n=1 Tax=Syphacia muris TaxID=451379 RepID=A0A0N5ACD1_9BILA